jgi:hypothetical protein
VLHLEHSFVLCWNLGTSDSRSEMPGELWTVVLERDGDDVLYRSSEKRRSVNWSLRGKEYPTHNKKDG